MIQWILAILFTITIASCSSDTATTTTAPSAPTGVTATAGTGQATISWTAVSGATSYNLYMATQSGVTKSNYATLAGGMTHASVTNSYVHIGLTNGTAYYFIVTAVNTSGESVESAQVSATPAAVGAKFPIAATGNYEQSRSAAFDGTNYLVEVVTASSGTVKPKTSTGQFVDPSGNLIGSQISVGSAYANPLVAFDGTNYLMVGYPSNIAGQFISPSGGLSGPAFTISTNPNAGGTGDIWGMAFGGGSYFVAYQHIHTTDRGLYGRIISPAGTVGNEILIGTPDGPGSGLNSVSFDGANFLIVWDSGTTIKGRFIGTNGNAAGSEFSIRANKTSVCGGPVNVAFDGTNYLVVWHDGNPLCNDAFNGALNLFGQIVTPSGTLSGGVINVSVASGDQILPSMAFSGTNYLVTWMDMRNDTNYNNICDAGEGTCWDIYGQYVSKSGALVGSEFVINNDAGNQAGGVMGFNNGKYFVLIDNMDTFGGDVGDVYGVFVTP